jgi:4-hydroxybenzoate polyprenyltransferase
MIKFEHSIFALPFALTAVFLATAGNPGWSEILWIITAMVGARSLAMTLNRLIDHHLDRANPRTASRALPAGLLRRSEAWVFAALALAILLAAVYQLHPICRYLWPPLVALFFFYPYTKRFTWTSHFFLGLSLGIAPIGAWVALTGQLVSPILALGLAVALWAAGFDIIYACQDVEVDRAQNLHSVPARFGVPFALGVARVQHLLSLLLLILTGVLFHLTGLYYLGLLIVSLLLLLEHRLVSPNDLSKLNTAFFATNGFIAALFFIFTTADLTLDMLR